MRLATGCNTRDKVVTGYLLIPLATEEVVGSSKPVDAKAGVEVIGLDSKSILTHRPGKEPVESARKVVEETALLHVPHVEETIGDNKIREREEGGWPFPHWISEVDS
ncbi:uncharacterized protein A4U43_C10F6920 [Asparagus officinalis]|uniref:Uncharacterized protein n=1 Tax=Asparagus officinalis TaxID=4686 RepID=A0A5P1E162_ASPOF|nr:uncharacterized protein A4U43_C10F6920 [Asparagus officinalis]